MARKKRKDKKRRRKSTSPRAVEAEVLEIGPGIRATRVGADVRLENRQTPEQQEEFLRRFGEKRAEVMAEFDDKVRELRDLLRAQSPLHLLADLTIASLMVDPDTFKEYDPRPTAIHVEWPTWLMLTGGPRPANLYKPADPELLARTRGLIHDLIGKTVMFVHTTTLGADSIARDVIQSRTRRTNLLVRAPSYLDHHWEVLDTLFGATSEDLGCIAGVSWDQVRRTLKGAGDLANEQANASRDNQRRGLEDVKKALRGESGCTDEAAGFVATCREEALADDDIPEVYLVGQFCSTTYLGFVISTDELAAKTSVSEDSTRAVLKLFASEFGLDPIGDSRPSVYEPLEERPLVALGDDRWMVHLSYKLPWAIKPRLERLLREHQRAWQRYERHRAATLEQMSVELLSGVSSHAKSWTNLTYEFDEGEGIRRYELDGLVLVDQFALVVEAKASPVRAAGRRGAKSVFEDLEGIIGHAHRQAKRAVRYLRSSTEVTFTTEDGSSVPVRSGDVTRLVPVTTTLDDVAAFATKVAELEQAGLDLGSQAAWTVYIGDLQVIAELVEGAGMLAHYLDRRLELERRPVDAHDELDWFGHYLTEGLYFDDPDYREAQLSLGTFTTQFDDYYAYKFGPRKAHAPKPRQHMPWALRQLVQRLEASGVPGFVDAVCLLLEGSGPARENFAKQMEGRRKRARKKEFSGFRTRFGDAVLGYVVAAEPSQWLIDEYTAAAKYEDRASLAVGICESRNGNSTPLVSVLRGAWASDALQARRSGAFFGAMDGTADGPR